jgi:hypothetical protein
MHTFMSIFYFFILLCLVIMFFFIQDIITQLKNFMDFLNNFFTGIWKLKKIYY